MRSSRNSHSIDLDRHISQTGPDPVTATNDRHDDDGEEEEEEGEEEKKKSPQLLVGSVDSSFSATHKNTTTTTTTTPTTDKHFTFFAPQLSGIRHEYIILLLRVLLLAIILMWGFLPLYWGSLATPEKHTANLSAWLVDRDGSTIGQGIQAAVQQSLRLPGGTPKLGWRVVDPSEDEVKDDESVMRSVVDEMTWLVVVVNTNATTTLLSSLRTGNTSYNPQGAISAYYTQARNEIAVGSYLLPIVTQLLTQATGRIGANITGGFLQQAVLNPQSAGGANTSAVIQNLARAPQAISNPVSWAMVNLRPFTAPVATALTLVGQIYLCIFAFIMTMANFNARQPLARHLTLGSYIKVRILVPLALYLPLSLSFAMISLPFKAPFDAKFTYVRGFFLYFAIAYLTMASFGLATEAMITLLGVRFMAFFLLALIISNVSVAALPNELQPGLYKYGKGWPAFNASQAIRTIIFDTKSHLGRNIGVIIAWIVLSVLTVALFTFLTERRARARRGRGMS